MARIRTIKPSFFRSRSVKKLSDKAKLSWIALWNLADDEGRLVDELGILVGDLWALSLSEAKLDKVLDELHLNGRIIRYKVAGQAFIQVTNWPEHQKISHPTPSLLPPGALHEDSRRPPVPLMGGKEGKGKETGGEPSVDVEPPEYCSLHWVNHATGACPQCADARRDHAAWARRQKNRPTVPGIITDLDCMNHPGRPARGCDRCAEEAAA